MPTARELQDLCDRVRRLTVSRRDPEAFFVERSSIADDLHQLSRAANAGRALPAASSRRDAFSRALERADAGRIGR